MSQKMSNLASPVAFECFFCTSVYSGFVIAMLGTLFWNSSQG